jgi:hypothetical protein
MATGSVPPRAGFKRYLTDERSTWRRIPRYEERHVDFGKCELPIDSPSHADHAKLRC